MLSHFPQRQIDVCLSELYDRRTAESILDRCPPYRVLTIRELEHIAFFCTFFAVMFHYYDLKLPNLTLICEDGKTRQQLSFFFFET